MKEQIGIGIVGMGIGRANGRALHADPRGRVVALCDLAEERMDEFAAELGAPLRKYASYQELCADPAVDAVFVGTPNPLHVPVGLEAVGQGKHVLVTKPLADSVAAARELVEAAEEAGVVNMMSLSTRFGPHVSYLGALARQEFFGEIYYARARTLRRIGIPGAPGFVRKGGGAFRDMGVHVLDSAWWICGMPEPVSITGIAGAKFGPRGLHWWGEPPAELVAMWDVDDFGAGFIRFENGLAMLVESFWASHQPHREVQIELLGTEAGATYDPFMVYRTLAGATHDCAIELPKRPGGMEAIAKHFLDCIADGVPCSAPLRHGLVVQEMLEGLLLSAATGREVRFGEGMVAG